MENRIRPAAGFPESILHPGAQMEAVAHPACSHRRITGGQQSQLKWSTRQPKGVVGRMFIRLGHDSFIAFNTGNHASPRANLALDPLSEEDRQFDGSLLEQEARQHMRTRCNSRDPT
jgi:hypothetical protein